MNPDFPNDHPRNIIPELCRLFYSQGWMMGSGGSLSIKYGQEIYITPSGVQKERVQPEDLFVQTVDGEDISVPQSTKGLRKSQCSPVFLSIYRLKAPGAVFHLHSKSAVLATLLNKGNTVRLSNLQFEGIRKWSTGGNYKFTDDVVLPVIDNTHTGDELIDGMVKAMNDYPDTCIVLVRGHGIYAWGQTWEQAKLVCESYDYLFDVMLQVQAAGVREVHGGVLDSGGST
ncbi:methylthioribulose-1-phosphate dehydratase-like [Mizuhopecten yessoensis]|uniref:methylthioribulose-1-phosphate dehydratase-like n=1 Tax=Mizuhopecten yessoensis TaxID=6573 RepID=UPI000B45A888|nr:methylthioribulose-1-phosphate dehydratase-like [Mizuhopecten yessoensis]XP_021366471.1 methylthioribulose-1-phosphate dehydratase-like [Mizuhopecten yessoensis]